MVNTKPVIALFGGSFDPPHLAHQQIVNMLSKLEDIDYVVVMPAYLNPFKKASHASAMQRLSWCATLFTEDNVIVSDFETSKQRSVYTIETIKALEEKYTLKYIAIGTDNLADIERWKDFDIINKKVIWLLFTRGKLANKPKILRQYKVIHIENSTSSSKVRDNGIYDKIDKKILKEVKKIYETEKHENKRKN